MYWALDFQSPQVEQVLERDNFTLEDVLDEEDCVKEVRALNQKLIEYFQTPHVTQQLVELAAGSVAADADAKHLQKFPFIASEILSSDIRDLVSTVLERDDLLEILFGGLYLAAPAPPLRVAFSCKVIAALLASRPREVFF